MSATATIRRRVEFAETDLAGWVHFSNYLRWAEAGEHACLRALGRDAARGYPIVEGWPKVHIACDYRRPVRFADEIEVRVTAVAVGSSSVTWEFDIRRVGDAEPAASGTMVSVHVVRQGDSYASAPVPADLAKLLLTL